MFQARGASNGPPNPPESDSSDEENQRPPPAKRVDRKNCVQSVEKIKSINGKPFFYIKYTGVAHTQTAWKTYYYLERCDKLLEFIARTIREYQMDYDDVLAKLNQQLFENPQLDFSRVNIIKDLDNFQAVPLQVDLIMLAQHQAQRTGDRHEWQAIHDRTLTRLKLQRAQPIRREQLVKLGEFQSNMNTVETPAPPIRVVNDVDLDTIDESFTYIKDSLLNLSVALPVDVAIGCQCYPHCSAVSRCCGRLAGERFAYERYSNRLRNGIGKSIHECSSRCSCDENCANRVVQQGRKQPLELFKTHNGRGWGVRTPFSVRKGEFICEYVGEIISSEEANERGKAYDEKGRTYLFDLDYNVNASSEYTIDAAKYGNISHFINHSCEPNLGVYPCWTENGNQAMPRLALFTIKNVKAMDELCYDYICADSANPYENLSTAERVKCLCGAATCRGVLF